MERKKIKDLTQEEFQDLVDGFAQVVDAPHTFKALVSGINSQVLGGQYRWDYVKENYLTEQFLEKYILVR